jgi:hypothetical protein
MNKFQEALNILKPNEKDVIHHKDGWWHQQNKAINTIQELVDMYEVLKILFDTYVVDEDKKPVAKFSSHEPFDYVNEIALMQKLVDRATPRRAWIKKDVVERDGYWTKIKSYYVCPVCQNEVQVGQCCSNNECRQALYWSADEV